MNQTNFIARPTPKQHRNLRYWCLFSLIFLSATLFAIIILSIQRIRHIDRLRKEKKLFEIEQARQSKAFCQDRICAQEQAQLIDRMKLITRWQEQKEFPFEFLKNITESLEKNISLEQITLNGTQREITLSSQSARELTKWGQKVSQTSWAKDLRLMTIGKKENKTIAIFKNNHQKDESN